MHTSQLLQGKDGGWRRCWCASHLLPAHTGLMQLLHPKKGQKTLDMLVQSVVPLSWGRLPKVWKTQGNFPSQLNPLLSTCCHVCVRDSLCLVEWVDGATMLCKIPLVPQIHAESQNDGKTEAEREDRKAPVQPPAHNKVSYESRSGGSGPYPAGSLKPPRMVTAQPLWAVTSGIQLSPIVKKLFSDIHSEPFVSIHNHCFLSCCRAPL